jgi:hypothetical protein
VGLLAGSSESNRMKISDLKSEKRQAEAHVGLVKINKQMTPGLV